MSGLASTTLTLAQAEADLGFPVLTSLIVVPVVGALLIALLPGSGRAESTKQAATIASAITGAISFWILYEFNLSDDGFQFTESATWVEGLGISWSLGIDGISLFLVVLTGLLFPIAILAVNPAHDHKPYFAWLLVLEAGVMGVFLTLDLFFFFVFFEIVLVPMYFLIGQWGHGNRKYAATKFFIYTMAGSALMLVGIMATAFLTASATGNDVTFNVVELAEGQALAQNTARWLFLSFALAFAVKTPLFPVHTWLPDAHTEAPTAGSVILAGVMLKLGTYGFIRYGLYLFPEASVYFAPLMLTLGVIGILYGAIAATMQKDLKRLVAYSSIAHLGFIVLGTFALNVEGIEGGLLQMVNHGVSTGALFLLVGMIYERRHTRLIAELSGLQKAAPVMAGVFTVVLLSSIGLPGLNGFVGEFLTLLGAFNAHRWWAIVAASGVILAALYLLWAFQRVFHGPAEGANLEMPDLKLSEGLVLAPLMFLIVFMGVYPKPVLERMEPAVEALVDHIEDAVPRFTEPIANERTADDAEHSDEGEEGSEEGEGE